MVIGIGTVVIGIGTVVIGIGTLVTSSGIGIHERDTGTGDWFRFKLVLDFILQLSSSTQ